MQRFNLAVMAAADHTCRALLLVMTCVVLWVVFGRYLLSSTPRWGEELALACLTWISLLSVALGISGRYHIRLDLLLTSLPKAISRWLGVINIGLSLLVGVLFVWKGGEIALQNLSQLMPGLGIPAFWKYLALPVSGVLILIAQSAQIFDKEPVDD